MNIIKKNLQQVKKRIAEAVASAGRKPGSVSLVAVSKTHPASLIRQAYAAGQREFAESYVQEAIQKITELQDYTDITWHFIGGIQSNKTRLLAEHFHWVHSVDRLKIAQRLSEQRPQELPPLNMCIEVNLSDEVSKSGVKPSEVNQLATEIQELPNIKLRGLMAIPLQTDDFTEQCQMFAMLRHQLEMLNLQGFNLDTLSMGMSDDMEAAIMEGATMVRVGTAIFGMRH